MADELTQANKAVELLGGMERDGMIRVNDDGSIDHAVTTEQRDQLKQEYEQRQQPVDGGQQNNLGVNQPGADGQEQILPQQYQDADGEDRHE